MLCAYILHLHTCTSAFACIIFVQRWLERLLKDLAVQSQHFVNANVNVIASAVVPLQSSSSKVLLAATRRPLIETGLSSMLVLNSPNVSASGLSINQSI